MASSRPGGPRSGVEPCIAAERERLIDQYAAGPARLRAAFAAVPDPVRQWRPAPTEWSAHEVVCHCADSESNASLRIRYLVVEPEPLIVGYDEAAWARMLDYHRPSGRDGAGHRGGGPRQHGAACCGRCPTTPGRRKGRHTESGRYTAEDWLRIYAEHLEIHARQIEQNLAAWHASLGQR